MKTPGPLPTILILALALAHPLATPNARGAGPVAFEEHAVVCVEAHASEVGRSILRGGGNAFDAAIGTALALAVTHPAAGNLGGGGFLVGYRAGSGEVVTVDFREVAPAAATESMYLGPEGRLLPRHRAGPRAAGVPGTVRGLGLIHERLGLADWTDLVEPAARLAREGFPISETLARSLNAQLFPARPLEGAVVDFGGEGERLADFPASVAALGRPDGRPWKAGDRLVQLDLAETLDRIAEGGPGEFYEGRTARLIADHMERNGGLVTLDDLRAYQAQVRPPIRTTYRGFEVCGVGPPSSGGLVVGQMLNILEHFDLRADGPRSPRTLHRVTETMRRAFYGRATAIADPAFVDVPVDRLLSKETADEWARSLGDRATPSSDLADFPILDDEGDQTTHLSVLDGRGNAVALTYTLEQSFGSKDVVAGAGFLLNNEMGDFNITPGRTDASGRIGTVPNRIAPGKRMLSSQTPTIVLRDGRVRLVTGSPGGRTIPNTVLWVILNVLEFGLDPGEAVAAPRTHHAWFPDVLTLEGRSWSPEVRADLEALGHHVRLGGPQGDAHTIAIDPETGRSVAVPDPRRDTSRAATD